MLPHSGHMLPERCIEYSKPEFTISFSDAPAMRFLNSGVGSIFTSLLSDCLSDCCTLS